MDVRDAEEAEIDHLAKVWHDAWQDAHAQIVPAELTKFRTLESFRERLQAAFPNIRVGGPSGTPVGFCIIKGDELYQLFVSSQSRGSGVAAALIADAEMRLFENGVETAWLACATGLSLRLSHQSLITKPTVRNFFTASQASLNYPANSETAH